jgi:acyl carrier protein
MNANLSESENQAVLEILVRELGVPPEHIKGEARIKLDLGADSLTEIQIAMTLEERFHVTLPDERLQTISTVDDLCAALAEALRPAPEMK